MGAEVGAQIRDVGHLTPAAARPLSIDMEMGFYAANSLTSSQLQTAPKPLAT